jgi:leucyl-tRNA synthetase
VPKDKTEEVESFVSQTLQHTDQQRVASHAGIWTGRYCEHPLTGEEIPIYIASYVLPEFGTGAVMGKGLKSQPTHHLGVPAHDQRDWDFAVEMDLPVKKVIRPLDQ